MNFFVNVILFYDEKKLFLVKVITLASGPLYKAATGCVLSKKVFFKNFTKLTGIHFCWIIFINKVADLRSATLLKKRFQTRCFFKNSFFHRTVSVAASVLCFCSSHFSLFLSIYFWFLFFLIFSPYFKKEYSCHIHFL